MDNVPATTDSTLEQLIDAYLAGELSSAEAARIRTYLDANPAHRGAIAALRATARGEDLGNQPPVEPSMQRLMASLDRNAHDDSSLVDMAPARLNRHHSPERWQFVHRWGTALAGVAAFAGIAFFALRTSPFDPGVTKTYTTRTGERASITLSDGTRITMAPQSRLRLDHFGTSSRLVTLEGEAYFDVSNTRGTPFLVQTRSATTRVLGTTFFVKQYATDVSLHVGVQSGKVTAVSHTPHGPTMTLAAAQIGDLTDSLATVRTTENAAGETAWLNDELVFTNAPVSDVLATLSRWYGYDFHCADPTLTREVITVGVSTKSPAQALARLEQLLNVDLEIAGNLVTLTPHADKRNGKTTRMRKYEMLTPSSAVGR